MSISNTRPGTKGWAVLEQFATAWPKGTTRQAVADHVGCTVQRVGEVVRSNNELVIIVQGGGYAIAPEAWKLYANGETDAARVATEAKSNVIPLRVAEPGQAAVNENLAAALAEPEAPEVAALSDAEVYKLVMADPANATDAEFERAVAFAKAKKRKRPQR